MVGTLVHQLTDGASPEELEKAGMGDYYTDHGWGVYPQAAAGFPYTAASMAVKGDPVADLTEDLAADRNGYNPYVCESVSNFYLNSQPKYNRFLCFFIEIVFRI